VEKFKLKLNKGKLRILKCSNSTKIFNVLQIWLRWSDYHGICTKIKIRKNNIFKDDSSKTSTFMQLYFSSPRDPIFIQ